MSDAALDPPNLAEDFLTTFNRIDKHLREATGIQDRSKTFTDVLNAFERREPSMRPWMMRLRGYADLRNMIVHERHRPNEFIAYPSRSTLSDLLQLEKQLESPLRVEQVFLREVYTLKPDDSVDEVLSSVKNDDFTQFPVYQSDGVFIGLLTGNGLTRWLASRPGEDSQLIDWREHTVKDVLGYEEELQTCEFIARATPVREAVHEFRNVPSLEALLITQTGSPKQKPIGIITLEDIAGYGGQAD